MMSLLQQLTGGVLLSRDTEFIVFYRGKDFLPSAVSTAIEERRNSEVGRQKQSGDASSMDFTLASQLRVATPASVDKLPEATAITRSITIKKALKPPSLAIKRVETKLSQVFLTFSEAYFL